METQKIGDKIRHFRVTRGISQMQLVTMISASPGSISKIESGKTNPTKESLFKIAEALELNSEEISILFDLNAESFSLRGLFEFNGDLTVSINHEALSEAFFIEMLSYIDNRYNLIGSAFSVVDDQSKIIQLKYISKNSITKYLTSRLFKEMCFRPLQLHEEPTLTKDAAIRNKIIYDHHLHKFIAPPLHTNLARMIQAYYKIGSMAAIPLTYQGKVISVLSLAIREEIQQYDKQKLKAFNHIKHTFEKVLSDINTKSWQIERFHTE